MAQLTAGWLLYSALVPCSALAAGSGGFECAQLQEMAPAEKLAQLLAPDRKSKRWAGGRLPLRAGRGVLCAEAGDLRLESTDEGRA